MDHVFATVDPVQYFNSLGAMFTGLAAFIAAVISMINLIQSRENGRTARLAVAQGQQNAIAIGSANVATRVIDAKVDAVDATVSGHLANITTLLDKVDPTAAAERAKETVAAAAEMAKETVAVAALTAETVLAKAEEVHAKVAEISNGKGNGR